VFFVRYTRNLVDEGNGKYNLMVLCWGEGMGSSIHDHADSHCFVKILSGEFKETLFFWPKIVSSEKTDEAGIEKFSEENYIDGDEDAIRVKGVNLYDRDQVTYINGRFFECFQVKNCNSNNFCIIVFA